MIFRIMLILIGDSVESDTFNGDFMVKSKWRLYGSLIYNIFSMKTSDNLKTNFTINLHKKYHSPHCLHTISNLTVLVI